jgi:hypothetical protein
MAYDNDMSAVLFRNERKRDDKDPDYTGSAEVAGVQYWLSAWVNEGGPQSKMAGKRFFSIKFRPKEARAAVAPRDDDMAPTPVSQAPSGPPPPKAATPPAPRSQVEQELDEGTPPF